MLAVAAHLNAVGYVWELWQRIAVYVDVVYGFTIFAITLPLGLLASGDRYTLVRGRYLEYAQVVTSFGIAIGAL